MYGDIQGLELPRYLVKSCDLELDEPLKVFQVPVVLFELMSAEMELNEVVEEWRDFCFQLPTNKE